MDVEVIFKDSAFKHGVTKADILKALSICLYDGLLVEDDYSPFPDKRVALGFDTKGSLLEVLYHETGENELTVYHDAVPEEIPYALTIGELYDKRTGRTGAGIAAAQGRFYGRGI